MAFITVGAALMAMYVLITLLAPLALSRPSLLIEHPVACLRLWLAAFILAALSLTMALGLFIALALRHHVTHIDGHDTVGPLVDQFLGWLSIAVVGVLAFRMGVAVQDARSAVFVLTGEFAPLIDTARHETLSGRAVWVLESTVIFLAARSGRVIASTALMKALTTEQLSAVLEHEHAHLEHRHARMLAISNIAEAIAPSVTAGHGFASAARITTELIADDCAAAVWGNETTASALEIAYPDFPGVRERVTRLRKRAQL